MKGNKDIKDDYMLINEVYKDVKKHDVTPIGASMENEPTQKVEADTCDIVECSNSPQDISAPHFLDSP
ncbi:hypothetical protein ACH5RR_026163 [Cinchona calisaya]|uniref:Uncharacterized protein n=1 Tax=Cinchona calisaya TaxID=153742 RepID=A0ABD2Z3N8_9GENT